MQIADWGPRKIIWVQSSNLRSAIEALAEGRVDGFGISPYKGYADTNINFLREVAPKLELLVIPLAEKYDLQVIGELRKLKCLNLMGPKRGLDLRNFKDLEDLILEWNKEFYLPEADSPLKRLFLKGYKPKSSDLSELPPYRRLEILQFVQGSFASLSGIERFGKLEKAEFAYATKLEYVRDLIKTKVKAVIFELCKKLKDFKSLSECPCLVWLTLSECGEIDSLAFLSAFRHLQIFRFDGTKLKDGDMSPLLKMKSVSFTKRRDYSHTPDQIRELIGDPDR